MVQTRATATGVAIIGMTKIPRSSPRIGNLLSKTSAAIVPKIIGATTERTV
ncbi:hypothetical protein D3C81_1956150 [compost metagenome]